MTQYLSSTGLPKLVFVAGFCFAAFLFLFGIGATVLSINGQYSKGASASYWCYFGIVLSLVCLHEERFALYFFMGCAPFTAGVMYCFERARLEEQGSSIHNEKQAGDGRIQ